MTNNFNNTINSCLNESSILDGKAKGLTIEDIAKKHNICVDLINTQLEMGIKIEMEHTKDKKIARKIAMDHLFEDPQYYTHLKSMEKKYIKEDIEQDDEDFIQYGRPVKFLPANDNETRWQIGEIVGFDNKLVDIKTEYGKIYTMPIADVYPVEESMASAGGTFGASPNIGSHGGAVGNSDWYAPGDARVIKGAGKAPSLKRRKNKSKRLKLSPSEALGPIQRRPIGAMRGVL